MKKTIIALTVLMLFIGGCSQKNETTTTKQEDSKVAKIEDKTKTSKETEAKKDDSVKAKETKKESKNEKDVKKTVSASNTDKKNKTETSKEAQSKDTPKTESKKEASNQSNSNNNNTSNPSKQEQTTPPPVEEKVENPIKQTAMANDVMAKINAYRQQNGLQPLQSTSDYQAEADDHALEMAQARALWHGDNGECITNHPDPFNAWINSPEHKAIILTPNNTQGVVSIYFVDGYYYSVFRTSW